jgi:hypothetical protein
MSRSATWSFALSLILMLRVDVLSGNAFAASPMLVEFEGAAQPLGGLQERLARERGDVPKDIPGDRLQAFLTKPDGNGPFAAVIALHGCSGLHEAALQSASDRLVSWGYVALLVDNFTTRSIEHACTPEKYAAEESNIVKRTFDAYGALLFLARQPFVDPRRVAVVGVSQGGMGDIVGGRGAHVRTLRQPEQPSLSCGRRALSSVFCSRCATQHTHPNSRGGTRRLDASKGLRADNCALGKRGTIGSASYLPRCLPCLRYTESPAR